MKKDFNIEQAEKWLSDGFKQTEKNIIYNGNALSDGREKRERSERKGFAPSPAVQLIGVFLVAALVGGGTFGALKYLEYKDSLIPGSQGGTETVSVTEKSADDADKNEVELNNDKKNDETYDNVPESIDLSKFDRPPYEYDDKLAELQKESYDGDLDKFAYVLTYGEVHPAFVYKLPAGRENSVKSGEVALLISVNEFRFGGDLRLYNNVSGREMNVRSVKVSLDTGGSAEFDTVEKAAAYIDLNLEKWSCKVDAVVSWDDNVDTDDPTLYAVSFMLFRDKTTLNQIKEDYIQVNENKDCRYLSVFSNGRYDYPAMGLQTTKSRVTNGMTAERSWGPSLNVTYVRYGDDFEILNNVKDKEWTEFSAYIRKQSSQTAYKQLTLQELNEYLREAGDGYYQVKIVLSWDENRLDSTGDVYSTYLTYFIIYKSGGDESFYTLDNPLYRNWIRYMMGDERYYENYLKYNELQREGSKNYSK